MFGGNKKPEENENQLKWYHYLNSLLFVFVGAVFVMYSQINMMFICSFFGCVFAAAGLISLITYIVRDVSSGYYRLDLVYGAMAGFAALLFFTKKDIVGEYFPIIIGCILLGNGFIKLQHSIDMKRIDRKMKKVTEMWLVVMIFALMCMASGFISVYLTPEKERTLFVFVGISLIVAGVTDIFTHIVFNKKVRAFRKACEEESEDEKSPEGSEEVPVADTVADENAMSETVPDMTENGPVTEEDGENAVDQLP